MTIAAPSSDIFAKSPAGLLAAGAAGFLLGLAANFGRKAMVQGVTAARGSWDAGLKTEHRMTLKIFDAIENTNAKHEKKRKALLVQLHHALAKHAVEEENVVYPAMRDQGLCEEADQLVHDHGYVKQYLFDLSEMAPSDPAWAAKLRDFRTELERHIAAEEETLFPRLRALLGDQGNAHVTAVMNKVGFAAA
ncbi:MAG: hemerythrin domain-containing protein [Sphingopyxis sp.]|nr:hemerythrin domain-containing protein [Sphingopyxis sp.]